MTSLLIYICCLIFLLSSYFFKSNTMKKISIFVSIIFVFFLFYYSTNTIDSVNYEFTFNNPEYLTDRLFYLLASIVKNSFNDYKVFRGCIGVLSMLPIIYISLKEGGYKCLCFVLAMFMIFPMFQNIVALRNTLASGLIVCSFYYLFKSNNTLKSYIISAILIIISAQIHSNMYIYLFVLLVYIMISRTKINYVIIIGLSFVIALLVRSNFIITVLSSFIPISKLFYITSVSDLGFGFILTILWQLAYFYISKKSYEKLIKTKRNTELDIKIYNFNKALLCIIPLYMINVLFFRLIRNILVFQYILVYKSNKFTKINERYTMMLLFTLNVVLMFIEASGYESIISILF